VRRLGSLAALLALAPAGCGGGSSSSSPATSPSSAATSPSSAALVPALRLGSPGFAPGGPIPRRYTCDGADLPLPLRWSGVPRRARELLVVMRDPDAPGGNFIHWAIARIRPSATSLPAAGAVEGRNSFGAVGYRGPCPPRGDRPHRYVITLSALAGPSGVRRGFAPNQAVRSLVLAVATLTGTYVRR
jgi:Raf kinase inhibitor-like YbhB/YbcL family protein